ncbi:hypothetical protein OOK29_25980 [Streptomyces phaeochromogenes]|uniref:hypothetical protein n=1 Tax=Streptomyces phaeochromogenes TaxID=1923 RepID=UPI0022579622|nr:hypothetical protein [Streptomyces phaeochromogenes]MCX5601604.1 hypothetical protein [Streptomyces phaeochromogenes]
MPHEMEKPDTPADLYWALGDEVNPSRPILTGDVFEDVAVTDFDGTSIARTVMVLDHPCSLRSDGVNLAPRLEVAEVRRTEPCSWRGGFNRMLLPDPFPGAEGKAHPCAAFLDSRYPVSPAQLEAGTRIACLSHSGINLLMQRWVKHSSRVTVPTNDFQEANYGVYEEADVIEEWCMAREADDLKLSEAMAECDSWLREDAGGRTRRDLLKDAQRRSTVRKQMKAHLKELRINSTA